MPDHITPGAERCDVYILLAKGEVKATHVAGTLEDVIIDYDEHRQPLGVEILDAIEVRVNGQLVAARVVSEGR